MMTNSVKQIASEKLIVAEILKNFSHISTSFLWLYSPWWTLASSKSVLHGSGSCDLHIQFLIPILFRSSPIDSSHLNSCFSTRRVPAGLRRVSFLQGFSSCIPQVFQIPQYSHFYHFNYVWFIVQHIKLIIVPCSSYTIIGNRSVNHS